MRDSLFRRITRYPVGRLIDPRENRLTEATAAALERVDGLAYTFVSCLVDSAARRIGDELAEEQMHRLALADLPLPEFNRVEVRTQVATRGGRFVDLELLLRPPVGSPQMGLLVWVEVKHGADIHGDQLAAYVAEIPLRLVRDPVTRVVVTLASRDWTPTGFVPASVLRVDWQDFARAATAARPSDKDPVQQWLLDEYVRYLEEEWLSDPDALNTASALALMEFGNAAEAIAGICEHAAATVKAIWGPPEDERTTGRTAPVADYGIEYWAAYPAHRAGELPAPTWKDIAFDWAMVATEDLSGYESPRGAFAFAATAAVATKGKNLMGEPANQEWMARRLADHFIPFWTSGYYRLGRIRYPDELLGQTSLEEQGRELGRWIAESFELLAQDPPLAIV